jgi:hypothetical protein
MSLSLNYPTISPSLLLDFANSGRLDPQVTFTRSSTATFFDETGVLRTANNDVPRFDYNPATLAAQGLLIEESRTNSIRNNTMVGAVAGAPGTDPTNWAIQFNTTTGLTKEIVGTGTDSGITYIDIRISGTSVGAGSFDVFFEQANEIAAFTSQTWTASLYWKLQAGSTTGFSSPQFRGYEYTAAIGFIRSTLFGSLTFPTSAALNTQRFTGTATLSGGATTAFVRPLIAFNIAAATAIDITLRIGLPQLELGAFATSVIPTTTTALTRAADVASVNTLSPWFNSASGTIYVEASIPFTTANSRGPIRFDDGTDSNRIMMRNGGANSRFDGRVVSGGSSVANLESAATAITANTTFKAALAYAVNDYSMLLNGGTLLTDTSGALPIGLSRLLIGNAENTTNPAGSLIRRIVYYPVRLPDAQLQAITA